MTDNPDGKQWGTPRLMLWIKSRQFTFTSIALVSASVFFVLAAFVHGFHRDFGAAVSRSLIPLGAAGAAVQSADRTEIVLNSVAMLLAIAGLTTGVGAVRRKEPVLQSLALLAILLFIVWCLWSLMIEIGWVD